MRSSASTASASATRCSARSVSTSVRALASCALARASAISKGTGSMRNSSCPCVTVWLSRTATSATRPATSALTATMWALT